jgi:protocatechuate 3,4-dioxygenase beta subunit
MSRLIDHRIMHLTHSALTGQRLNSTIVSRAASDSSQRRKPMAHRLLTLATVCASIAAGTADAAARATATGKVIDGDGKPIEHATILIYEARVRRGYSVYCPTCWVDCGKRTATDAAGTYSIAGLDSDLVFKLLIVKNGYKTAFVEKVDPAKGPAADAVLKPRVVVEDASQAVRGRVVDEHGKPVRNAVVEQKGVTFRGPRGLGRAFGPNDSPDWIEPLGATDEQGEFEIAYAKPAVEITLNVFPRAMAPRLVTLPTGPERKTIGVTQGVTIRGRLLQPDGAPARNAEIGVVSHSRASGTVFPEVRIGTKDDGAFAITNIPAGRIWYIYPKMESLAARGLAGDAVPVETKDDGDEVDVGAIRLRLAYTLRGTVALLDGKPIPPDMHVTLSSDAGFDSQIAALAEDGSFEFRGLAKGVYSIAPGVRGYKPADGFYGEVLVDRDDRRIRVPMSPAVPSQ